MSQLKLSEAASFVLASIGNKEGFWGRDLLDRVLPINGFSGVNAMDVLFDLTARGLIEAQGDPKTTTYSLTDAGRSALSDLPK